MTVTGGASVAQVRAVRDSDLSDSQADSAGSIRIIRLTRNPSSAGMPNAASDVTDKPTSSPESDAYEDVAASAAATLLSASAFSAVSMME